VHAPPAATSMRLSRDRGTRFKSCARRIFANVCRRLANIILALPRDGQLTKFVVKPGLDKSVRQHVTADAVGLFSALNQYNAGAVNCLGSAVRIDIWFSNLVAILCCQASTACLPRAASLSAREITWAPVRRSVTLLLDWLSPVGLGSKSAFFLFAATKRRHVLAAAPRSSCVRALT